MKQMSTQVKRMYERCKGTALIPLKVLTIILFLLPSIKSFAAYCVPTFTSYSTCVGGNITNVSIGTLSYSTSCMVGGGYRDLTSMSTSFSPGQSYPVSLTIAGGGWFGGTSIWIDFDHDEVFSAGERVFTTPYTGSSLHTGTLVIPTTGVLSGPTRMRVMGRESSAPGAGDACGGGYGEAHDYTVIIGAAENNAGAVAIVEPVSMAFCPGTYDVKVRISNNGTNAINGVNVNWEVDGVPQTGIYWTTTLDTFNSNAGNKALVNLGSYTFTGGVPTTIKAWTSMPNGVADTVPSDDTVTAVITSACPVFPAPYCTAPVTGYVVPLTKVSFGGFVNPSSDASTTPHEDFTAVIGTAIKGSTSDVIIEGSTESAAYRYYAKVYIDWNKNNNFNDPGESYNVGYLYNSTGVDGQTIQTSITVPQDAVTGTTRMRVTLEYNSYSASACGVVYGQVEDYTLEVLPAAPNDAKLVSYIKPASFCPGAGTDISVKIGNKGSNIINTVNVDWEVDGVAQPTFMWNTPLDTIGGSGANEVTVTIGNIVFATDDPKTFKVWTAMPNGVADTSNANDTITFTIAPALSGTFTIGATGDYATIADALSAISGAGICGPTVFNVQSGTYSGAVNFGTYNGVSAVNTVTFQGAGVDSTIFTNSGTTTFTLQGTDHFIFRDMTIRNTSSSSGTVVYLTADGTDAADSNSIINCRIISPVAATSSGDFGVLASGYPGSLSDGNNANGTLVDSCYILGGEYGAAFQNESSNYANGNTVRNCTIDSVYNSAVTIKYQNNATIRKNNVLSLGLNTNTTVWGFQIRDCGDGLHIDKNRILGAPGGFAIYMLSAEGTVANPNIVSNNMFIIGTGTNTALGIYSVWCNNVDFVYNTIDIRSNGSNTVTPLILNAGTGHTIVNNIFRNANAGTVIDISNAGPFSNIKLDRNCYYGTGTYPFRFGGNNYSTLADFKAAAAMINSDSFSIFTDPVFFSTTDLRTNDIMVDGKGMYYPNVLTDIDDSLRSTTRPDIGVNEFTLPDKEDASVTAILIPKIPVTPGPSDVKLVIKNAGVGDLTSVDVNYEFNGTIYTQVFTTTIPQGESDTVEFNSTSGMFANDQRFVIPSFGTFEIKAWTSNPNGLADKETSNDSLSRIYCQPMHGTYTIDPAGSGPNNFASFEEAIGGLNCGGISAAVVFEVASGTYANTQFSIPFVFGSDSLNTITFKSAANNPDSVLITFASTNVNDNYVVELLATEHVTLSNMTFQNTGASFARAIYLNSVGAQFNHHINIDSCVLNGIVTTTSNADLALVYGMENNTNLSFTYNRFNNGARGIILGGTTTKHQYSENVTVSHNTFSNNYAGAMVLSNRNHATIEQNTITATGSNTSRYGIFLGGTAGKVKISRNNIAYEDGTGIHLYNYCYYGEDGAATVSSNIVHLTSTASVAQTGISLVGSSIANVYNNTVRLYSSSAASRAMYVEGDITYANLQNLASTGLRIANNIFHTQNGYPIYFAQLWWNTTNPISRMAVAFLDYNIYYTEAGDYVAYIIGTDIPTSTFASLKGSVNNSNDIYSRYLQPVYAPASNFTPDVNNVFAWYINGGGIQLAESDTDYTGLYRPTVREHGVPDIGAYEITPANLPPLATATPATAVAGGTQVFTILGDTVAKITWDINSNNIPTRTDFRIFPGEMVPFANVNTEHMFFLASLSMPDIGGTYSYSIEIPYRDTWLGTNSNEFDLRMADMDSLPTSVWSFTGFPATDSVANIMSGSFATASRLFTGTNGINPLPVKLTSFSGKRASADAQLQWNTASEKQAGVFEVQRSADGVSFETAGIVKAKGNSNSNTSYKFTDVNVFSSRVNVWYYRLKMIDANGAFEYSKVIRIENRIASADMSLYPNPVSEVLNITVPQGSDHSATVSIKTVQGTEVMKATVTGNGTFTVPGVEALSNGLYIIELHYAGTVYTQKFTRL